MTEGGPVHDNVPPAIQTAEVSVPGGARDTLTARTLHGVKWTYFSTGITAAMQMLFTAVISRVLEPAAFGLIALAMLALRFSTHFAHMGIGQALVQKPDLSDKEIRAGFTSGFLLGVTFSGLVWIAAPLAVVAFNEPDVVPVLRAMGLTLVLTGLGTTAESLLRRHMRFRVLAIRQIASYAFGYFCVGLPMAVVMDAGAWSLVGASLTQTLVQSLLAYQGSRHSLRPIFEWSAFSRLYGFGSRVSALSFLNFLGNNLDTFAVGRFAGTALLGQYNRAFFLVNLPLSHLTTNLSKVLVPSFSRIQMEGARVKRAYTDAVRLASLVLIPLCAGLAVASRDIVLVVLGDQWNAAAAILPFFAWAGAFRFLSHFAGMVCQALAELNKKLALEGAHLVVLVGMLYMARGREIWVYAAALAVAETLRHGAYLLLMQSVLGVRVSDVARIYWPSTLSSALVAVLVFAGQQATHALEAPAVLRLFAELALGAVGLLAAFRSPLLRTARRQMRHRLHVAGLLRNREQRSRLADALFGG